MTRLLSLIFCTATLLGAAPISVLYYNTPNGAGSFYVDETYLCQGIASVACTPDSNASLPLAPLTGGKGVLTDGIIAASNWNINATPYVGWDFEPLIEFYFAPGNTLTLVTLQVDDSDGLGGVNVPASVIFSNGAVSLTVPVTDVAGSAPTAITFDVSSLGATAYLSISPQRRQFWTFISEVQFEGNAEAVPEPSSGTLFAAAVLATLAMGALRRQSLGLSRLPIPLRQPTQPH